MSISNSERIRQAARDGYVDLLRETTSKDCNLPDDGGMTATHWASFAGNLNALRIIAGRGGDPGRPDQITGSTSLHLAAANGHFACVSFLVSFGCNPWALDNQLRTARDVAAINGRDEIVEFLDHIQAKQSALNTRFVQKLKEKALADADKRIKAIHKFQAKTAKLAEKEERKRKKNKKLLIKANSSNVCSDVIYSDVNHNESRSPPHTSLSHPNHIYDTPNTINLTKSLANSTISSSNSSSSSLKFSELVLNSTIKSSKLSGSTTRTRLLSAVSKKVLVRKHNSNDSASKSQNDAGSMRGTLNSQIMFAPRYGSLSVTNLAILENDENEDELEIEDNSTATVSEDSHNADHLKVSKSRLNTFNKNIKTSIKNKIFRFNNNAKASDKKAKGSLYRTISEPDFLSSEYNLQLQHVDLEDVKEPGSSSIFERPGFGSVSFRGKFTPQSLFSTLGHSYRADSAGNSEDDDGHDSGHSPSSSKTSSITKEPTNRVKCLDRDSFASDSIGSAGSLVHLDEDTSAVGSSKQNDDDDNSESMCSFSQKSIPVLLFLYSQGLKEYFGLFEAEKIDIDALMLLTEQDLIGLGIPLGPRRKLMNAIKQRKNILDDNSLHKTKNVFETKL